jgi:uncharacterized Zn finger protein (UPF0148 family)
MPHQCPVCGHVRSLYLYHGKLFCALCWQDDRDLPPLVRLTMLMAQSRELREQAREVRARCRHRGNR